MSGKYNTNYDGEVVIANDFFLNNVIDQQEELEVHGGGGGGDINPPVAETEMVNETKGLKILWANFRGGKMLLTQRYFLIPYMKFTNMLAMWFCGDISKNIRPYRMIKHVNGGKQK